MYWKFTTWPHNSVSYISVNSIWIFSQVSSLHVTSHSGPWCVHPLTVKHKLHQIDLPRHSSNHLLCSCTHNSFRPIFGTTSNFGDEPNLLVVIRNWMDQMFTFWIEIWNYANAITVRSIKLQCPFALNFEVITCLIECSLEWFQRITGLVMSLATFIPNLIVPDISFMGYERDRKFKWSE